MKTMQLDLCPGEVVRVGPDILLTVRDVWEDVVRFSIEGVNASLTWDGRAGEAGLAHVQRPAAGRHIRVRSTVEGIFATEGEDAAPGSTQFRAP
jgi:hypothetical protein